jgi:hypothetical protein
MAELITVLVTEIRPIKAADGNLHELVVRDQTTGAIGSVVVTTFEALALLEECPTSNLVDVDRDRIAWSPSP